MILKPIQRKHLFEEIIVAIEEFIQTENISPGEKLPSENELSEHFGVSKTVIREALSVLKANGIIEKKSGAGIFLRDTDVKVISKKIASKLMEKDQLQQIMEFRRGIEVEAAGIAALKATREDINLIERSHEKLMEAYQNGSIGIDEDYQFHAYIIKASYNPFYQDTFNTVSKVFEDGMRLSKLQSAKLPGRFNEVDREHRAIITGLLEQNPKKASGAMREHLLRTEEKIWANLEL